MSAPKIIATPAIDSNSASVAADSPAQEASTAPGHGEFDFWLGQWQVRTADGKLAGCNRIVSEYAGHVLHERYETERGYRGESLNIYDAGRSTWHQTWVDNSGALLVLEGGLCDGSMVLEGQTVGTDAGVTKHRITWTPNADGSVRQLWESSDEDGQWRTAFDGMYTRDPACEADA